MGTVQVANLGKAYKQYPNRWSRLAEWLMPSRGARHTLRWVLQDVSFSVDKGEAVGIIGANGAGKSTLLKLITGTTQSTTGSVQLKGRVSALLELGMGFHADFTGRQNVYMAGQLLGLTLGELDALMPEIEAFADIGYYIDEPVRIYSSGMQVRLAFSVATARRPELLIVDEALSVGDAHFQRKSFSRIREFQNLGTTLLLVSHDLAAVTSICTRAVWLDKGIVRAYGPTRAVVDEYAASVYSRQQNVALERLSPAEPPPAVAQSKAPEAAAVNLSPTDAAPRPLRGVSESEDPRDVRQDFVNATTLRNDIRAFDFDRAAARWGNGDIRVAAAGLQGDAGQALSWIVGGEKARVVIEATVAAATRSVLVGFVVKDRTGQPLFGDNTYLRYIDDPVSAPAGARIRAQFEFRMPRLPRGSYVMAVCTATGTQENHVIEEWIDEAILFESHNVNLVQGLVGIPMQRVQLDVISVQPEGRQ